MDITKAVELFEELRSKIDKNLPYLSRREIATRVLLVDPILEMLGWDVRNPDIVELEFEPETGRRKKADYVLKNEGRNVAIIEAKILGADISELKYRDQADGYARYAGAKFFIITNGASWALYERDVNIGLETLEPIVKFDYRQKDPISCALDAVSLWRENPVLGTKPVVAHESLLSDPETGVPEDIDDIDTDWIPINDPSLSVTGKEITAIKIQGVIQSRTNESPGGNGTRTRWSWSDLIPLIATWLVDIGKLKTDDCPVFATESKIKNRCLINDKPAHPDGSPFTFNGRRGLPHGMWVDTYYNHNYRLQMILRLLEKFDVNPGVVEIKVEKRNQ